MLKIILKSFLILLLVGAGFFCFEIKFSNAANLGEVVINEIAWMGATISASDEWLELKNTTNGNIDLTGWSLVAQDGTPLINLSGVISSLSYFLLERTDDNSVPDVKADIFYSGALSNEGEILGLRDQEQNLIDLVSTSTSGWLAGDNTAKKTMERQTDGTWQTSQNVNGTPRAVNSGTNATTSYPNTPDATSTPADIQTATSTSRDVSQLTYNFGDVLINEFVSDPADNEVEWIELYNKIGEEINLTDWWIEEGSKAKTKLTGIISPSGLGRYKVFEKPAGNLNNDGDIIILYNSSGKIIDQVAYGDWNDGDKNNNALVSSDPFAVARKFDGYNSFNNANDFSVTIKPTKNVSNIIQAEDEVSAEAKAKFDFSNDIFISEILPNPTGDDAKLEFIEIYNASNREVNLTGWSLSNEDNKKNNFEKIATSTIIKADEYLVFFRPRTKIVLHNDNGQVELFQPLADKPIQTVKYKNVEEGLSYNNANCSPPANGANAANNANVDWTWSEIITPGKENVFKIVNHAPEVKFSLSKEALVGKPIIFDSSDTVDQDDDELKFVWDFGDGFKNNLTNPEHTYLKVGIYKVKLEVSDGKDKVEKVKSVKVLNSINETNNISEIASLPLTVRDDKIIINEIFPNPKHADKNNEWLELKNQSSSKINLKNWQAENSNGKYKFKNNLWIDIENFYLLSNKESKLAFKNTEDVVSLYNDNDGLVDQAEYTEAIQGEAYARGENGKWFWTTAITPGAENIINVAKSKAGIRNQVLGIMVNGKDIIETTLEKISQCDVGDLLKVKGKVAVLPGVLGAQYFYIVGSPGLQIYNYKKEFPGLLKVGDYIEVAGELSEINGEARLKTKDLADIKILEHQTAPTAKALSSDQFSEEYLGQLVSITGEVTDRKSSTVYLDDGNDEIEVYLKKATGIKPSSIEEGKIYTIAGIAAKTQSGLKLMPRSNDDIVIQNQTAEDNKVLGEVAVSNEWEMANRNKKLELFKYLLIIATGAIILLIGLIIKIQNNKKIDKK